MKTNNSMNCVGGFVLSLTQRRKLMPNLSFRNVQHFFQMTLWLNICVYERQTDTERQKGDGDRDFIRIHI